MILSWFVIGCVMWFVFANLEFQKEVIEYKIGNQILIWSLIEFFKSIREHNWNKIPPNIP